MKYNICPFARQEVERNSIRYQVFDSKKLSTIASMFVKEFTHLNDHPEDETSLVILPSGFNDFNRYLEAVYLAEGLIADLSYEGIYQIASFHPEYCFEDEEYDSPANYTNRSPYPMIHIIREESIEKALENYAEPESIPERNINFANKKGSDFFKVLLDECVK